MDGAGGTMRPGKTQRGLGNERPWGRRTAASCPARLPATERSPGRGRSGRDAPGGRDGPGSARGGSARPGRPHAPPAPPRPRSLFPFISAHLHSSSLFYF